LPLPEINSVLTVLIRRAVFTRNEFAGSGKDLQRKCALWRRTAGSADDDQPNFVYSHINAIIRSTCIARRAGIQRAGTLHDRWWGPVWRGLTAEETARHYRAMGAALWLCIYLIAQANRKTGELFRLTPSIAKDMGLSEPSGTG
jgi:hypothetical protein